MKLIKTKLAAAVFGLALGMMAAATSQADTFGSGGNEFTIDFVTISHAGNAADTTGYGAVPYEYRMGTYEISQDAIDKATASGMTNVTAGAWAGNQPAALISWYQAAAFVNWLNTSTGKQAAYDLTWNGSAWSMALWDSADAWQAGGENLYRHKGAYYFLPSEDEWYKSAYYSGSGSTYYDYPTGSDTAPTAVSGGTNAGTAVYGHVAEFPPADIDNAGGLSFYGTMAQGGNVWELNESAYNGANDDPTKSRSLRGGSYYGSDADLLATSRLGALPSHAGGMDVGFRVASIPEPSSGLLMLLAGALFLLKRKKISRMHCLSQNRSW